MCLSKALFLKLVVGASNCVQLIGMNATIKKFKPVSLLLSGLDSVVSVRFTRMLSLSDNKRVRAVFL